MIACIRDTVARGTALLAVLLCMAVAGLLSGCSHAISPQLLRQADQNVPFAALRQDPQAYLGALVVLGGVVVQAHVTDEGTLLEVYQTKTNHRGEPIDLDVSQGRFVAFSNDLLDPAIYRQGRRVTLAGRVEGEMVGQVGDVSYNYPSLSILEIRLWEDTLRSPNAAYPRYFRDPWDPWDPWGPYGRRYPPSTRPFYRPYSRW